MNTLTYEIINDTQHTPFTRIILSNSVSHHNHTFYEFAILLDGNYTNVINGVTYHLKKGSIIMLRPEDEHFFTTTTPHTHQDIYVQKDKLKAVCDSIDAGLFKELTDKPLVINFSLSDYQLQLLETKLNTLNNLLNRPSRNFYIIYTSVITEILYLWKQNDPNTGISRSGDPLPLWISTLIHNINTEEYLLKNIDEIIETTKYSHGYVCRQFKKYTGLTLNDYLINAKFNYSLALLQNTDTSISEIAEKLNYSSVSNFTVAFKAKYGLTPSQWRQNIIG